ncbi:Hypothetical predicted protein, partial [Marmota monax]
NYFTLSSSMKLPKTPGKAWPQRPLEALESKLEKPKTPLILLERVAAVIWIVSSQ